MSREIHDMVVEDIDRAAKHLNQMLKHTTKWESSEDPAERMLFLATHDLLGTLANVRTGLMLMAASVSPINDHHEDHHERETP